MGSWEAARNTSPPMPTGTGVHAANTVEVIMLHTATANNGTSDTAPLTVPILKFLVRAPGTGPDVTYADRWKAEAEATKLREDHGYDTVVVPVVSHPPFNPWRA